MPGSLVRAGIVLLVAAGVLASATAAPGQELEPRSYSAAPVGTNFLVYSLSDSSGEIGLRPGYPVSDVTADIDLATLGYTHSFDLAGRLGSVGFLMPYVQGNVSGTISQQGRLTELRSGYGDIRARLVVNFIGNPALTPAEFARRKPATIVGFSESLIAPTGAYDPDQVVNIGANRWSFKSELGMEQPIGKAFVDASAGIWFFTTNDDFNGGQERSQRPLDTFQVHAGYNFQPGLWLAADGTYYQGGAVSTNGAPATTPFANSRYGLTLAVPIGRDYALKASWSSWLSGRYGQNFSTASLGIQYRWFDRQTAR